jgi:putative transposase
VLLCQITEFQAQGIKIALMIDEHTRESLLNIVERSITAQRLVAELEVVFAAAGGPPYLMRMDNGPELVSHAVQQFCDGKVGMSYIPPGQPWDNGCIESFNNDSGRQCRPIQHPVVGRWSAAGYSSAISSTCRGSLLTPSGRS